MAYIRVKLHDDFFLLVERPSRRAEDTAMGQFLVVSREKCLLVFESCL